MRQKFGERRVEAVIRGSPARTVTGSCGGGTSILTAGSGPAAVVSWAEDESRSKNPHQKENQGLEEGKGIRARVGRCWR